MARHNEGAPPAVQIGLEHVQAPDGEERLRRALDLVLRAAVRAEEQADEPDSSVEDGHPQKDAKP